MVTGVQTCASDLLTPETTARPQLIRPVMFSTWRRSVPTIARYWTGKPSSLRESTACCEATAAFGRGECFVEQYLHQPRHVEVQVMADAHGRIAILGTRDCSLQRRNQKLVEEAPAPFLSDAQRQRLHQAARDICARAGYVGAGTAEFLVSRSGAISFLEVNTRLQVEHPVTEETTGCDLVIEQLRIDYEIGRASCRERV